MVDVENEVDVVFVNIVREYRLLGLAFSNDRIEYQVREYGDDKVNKALAIFRDKDLSEITTTPEKYFDGILRNLIFTDPGLTDAEVRLRETRRRMAREREIEEEIRREGKSVECEKAAKRFFNMAKQLAEKMDVTFEEVDRSSTRRTPRPVNRSWKPSPETIQHWRDEYGFVMDPETAAKNNIIIKGA